MAVLGILTCEILELEFAHLLTRDPDKPRITVLDDQYSTRFIQAVEESGGPRPTRIPLLKAFSPISPDRLEVVIQVLRIALHNRKKHLQEALSKATREMGRHVDAIVLGYGLCGNALEKPDEIIGDAGVPVFIPMDDDHPVDDCIGLIIGGRENYYGEQCKVAGTFFMIPGWTSHWRGIFDSEYGGGLTPEMAKEVFAYYERSLIVTSPVLTEEEMRGNIREFNQLLGFRTEVRPGTMDILQRTWDAAKASLFGRCSRSVEK
jgi:Protein of unknown function (DUF1638)